MKAKEKILVTSIFSFSYNVFLKDLSLSGREKSGLCGKELVDDRGKLSFSCNDYHSFMFNPIQKKKNLVFMTLGEKSFENIVGKLEDAGNQCFFLQSQCFPPCLEI